MRLLDYLVWLPGLQQGMDPSSYLSTQKPSAVEIPKLSFLPLAQRRRLSPLGRVVLSTLYPLFEKYGSPNCDNCSVIFASRWGDILLTVKALEELISEKSLSPTVFSTSVHNAIGGLFSMCSHFKGNITSIVAGDNTICSALTEAKAQLSQYPLVFLSIYEDKTPEAFEKFRQQPFPYAITLVFSNQSGCDWTNLWQCYISDHSSYEIPSLSQFHDFIDFLKLRTNEN